MSDVVEKTLTALPSLLSLDSQPGSAKLSTNSKLGSLIRGITELTSKHEEEKLIQRELSSIKEQVSSPNTTMRQMKELMVRTIYCEMLGYEATFSYIHAIKLAQQGNVLEKRVGYLAVSLFLNESHELLLLLVNTVLKDLQSTNLIEVCMALTVVSQMFPKDMIPAILPLVEEKLNHSKEIIRRKAVLALYKFYLIAPNQVQHIHNRFRKALCDKDPGVMSASLHIYLQLIQENPESYKDLTASFVTILKQVVAGKLPMDFNYHSVPAPWLQIQLLRILSLLGKSDQSTSEVMYEILDESLRRAEMNHNITYAILYECVKCIYTIHPKSELLEKAAKVIGNFVLSQRINLKYLGLKALTYVVHQDPRLALQHQMTIIECLDHPDVIIKRETLELLFRITNDQNVTVIVEKMLDFMSINKEDHTTADLVGKVAELAEKYAPDNEWFVETMNTVFSVGGDTLQPDIPNSFLKLLSEGFDDEEENKKLRLFAVNSYISLLQGEPSKLPQRFLQAICWVLGEYSHLREDVEPDLVLRLLVKLLNIKSTSSETKSWILMAMTKLCSGGAPLSVPLEVSETYSSSMDTMLRQRAQELQYLSQNPELQARVLPRGVSQEPMEVDSSLSFLDGFVSEALAAGAAPYKPPHQRQEELSRSKALSLEPYGLSLPISMSSCSIADRQSPTLLSVSSGLSGDRTDHSHKGGSTTLKLDGVRRVWGKEGYLAQRESAEETAPVEAPSPLQPLVQQGDGDASYSQTPTPIPECEQEKQQLASSLFVGLASQSSVCLMGKSEQTSQRFRRKLKDPAASFPSSTQNPLVSPPSSVGHLLLDSSISSDLISSPEQTHLSSVDLTVANGEVELPDRDMKGIKSTLLREDSALAAGSSPHEELDRPKDSCLTSHLPAELSGLPHSEITPLCTSPSLDLSSCHVQKDDSLVLLVFMKSSSDYDIQQIQVQVTCEELEVSCVCDSPVEELKSHGVVVCQYFLTVKSPSVYFVLSGMMSHQIPDNSLQETQFSHRIPLTSFLRPLRLSTEEYGTMWLAFSHDTKQNLPLMMDAEEPLTATLKVLKDKLQLHVVEIIGNEGIVACCLRQDQPCLLHCRVHAGMLAVWLRSPIPELPDCLLYHCQRALQES
ncbi:AP-4 complex subunit epsilon-1 isoform X1 [Nothobranchius furzeri]|uniref:AP-4 complex subunit epsilon n=3 Tax=Nothobranchius TaxID=28779 RepID=A0A1A8AGQ5_NOTFU|nr:AP-4 complex subunit epsilon-1 isoform X1 [Nothobranchius furzeri]KAF7224233.1 transcript variant X1 [Nothobranchius furzeri]